MDINEFTERFFKIEHKLRLFEEKIENTCWWDAVRFYVFYDVYDQLAKIERLPVNNPALFFRIQSKLAVMAERGLLLIKQILFDYDVIAFRAPRHRSQRGAIDVSMDPILRSIGNKTLVIDTYPRYFHRSSKVSPAKMVQDSVINKLNAVLSCEFKCHFDLTKIIHHAVDDFFAQIDFYNKLFTRTKPSVIFLTQNGIEKGMMVSARRLNIPLVEVQHGYIGYAHPVYSYPANVRYDDVESLPSHLLTYSEFWNKASYMPSVTKFVIGKPSTEKYIQSKSITPEFFLLIISADKYHDVLCEIAITYAKNMPNKFIAYKLHPKQSPNQKDIRRHLESWPNIKVYSGDYPVTQLIKGSSAIVTVQSTVVYEALQAGLSVGIVAYGDYLVHRDVFDLKQVVIIDPVDPLSNPIPKSSDFFEVPTFFDLFDPNEVLKIDSRLIAREAASCS